jgi:cytochrome c-type biogenesis protein
MFENLQQLLNSAQAPLVAAALLGLMSAISAGPLASNITAAGYVSRHIHNRIAALIHGLLYILGRMVSYSGLGLVVMYGADKFELARFFQLFGENYLGVIFIVIGVFLLDIFKLPFRFLSGYSEKWEKFALRLGYFSTFILGVVFALAFCPYSGVLYFGMLIPMVIASPEGFLLLMVFAIATGLPVLIVALLIAFPIASIGKFYDRIKIFEFYLRRTVAIVFLLVGVIYLIYFNF